MERLNRTKNMAYYDPSKRHKTQVSPELKIRDLVEKYSRPFKTYVSSTLTTLEEIQNQTLYNWLNTPVEDRAFRRFTQRLWEVYCNRTLAIANNMLPSAVSELVISYEDPVTILMTEILSNTASKHYIARKIEKKFILLHLLDLCLDT